MIYPHRTVRDAIADLPELEAGEQADDDPLHVAANHRQSTVERIEEVPTDGGSRHDISEDRSLDCHDDVGRAAGNVYGRMVWDTVAPTMTGRCCTPSTGRFVHPEQHRGITPREAARLQSFPDDYWFPPRRAVAEGLIGNAVPPRLSAVLAASMSSQF